MKKFFTIIFNGLDGAYFIKQYVFGGMLFLFLLNNVYNNSTSGKILIVINLIIFPFAMFVYDSVVGIIMGNTVIFTPILFKIAFTFFKVFTIYMLGIFIAPFGMAYIYFATRKNYI
ncbi:MAG: hypothetical protein RR646_06820 [Erysipelotrichaceae bacterium]